MVYYCSTRIIINTMWDPKGYVCWFITPLNYSCTCHKTIAKQKKQLSYRMEAPLAVSLISLAACRIGWGPRLGLVAVSSRCHHWHLQNFRMGSAEQSWVLWSNMARLNDGL